MKYRTDIDGLRAFAVIAVIIFHLGYLPNGYLGVDVFFVISGFLITSIMYYEKANNKFSIVQFYKRRIRRILPLLLFITSLSVILGLIFLLPHDLKNLAQSVIASNISINNIQLYLTSSNYWESAIEYKPLMHTWSLGVEEQFYLIYPLIFLTPSRYLKRNILFIISLLTILSITLFVFYGDETSHFYLFQYRFFELSIGGIFAILFYNIGSLNYNLKYLYYASFAILIFLLVFPLFSNMVNIILTVLSTSSILLLGKYFHKSDPFIKAILMNKYVIYIGKISFSLYMWHQLIFAFAKYSFIDEISLWNALTLVLITFILSIFSYKYIENTFRNKKITSFKTVVIYVLGLLFVSTVASFYLRSVNGVYKDFSILNEERTTFEINNLINPPKISFTNYNDKINSLNSVFLTNKTKILIIGDSFGRDLANIILESTISKNVEISYINTSKIDQVKSIQKKWEDADYIFISSSTFLNKTWLNNLCSKHSLSKKSNNLYYFGTKNFGYSMGIPYTDSMLNNSPQVNYSVSIRKIYFNIDLKSRNEWGDKFISLLDIIKTKNNQVLTFNEQGKLLSHDTAHLTKEGAKYFAKRLTSFLESL